MRMKKGEASRFPFPLKPGAGDESRTRDLNLGKVALYQLSYSRVREVHSSTSKDSVNTLLAIYFISGHALRR